MDPSSGGEDGAKGYRCLWGSQPTKQVAFLQVWYALPIAGFPVMTTPLSPQSFGLPPKLCNSHIP